MIKQTGWESYCIWEHSQIVKDLYAKRCKKEVVEMTAHAQACKLLLSHISENDILLDVGCGSGYFYHALRKRKFPVQYYGIDAAPSLISIGKKILPKFGLNPNRLINCRVEDIEGEVDHSVCINVLSNIDNYHRPLERMLQMSRKTVVLRESCGVSNNYLYVKDKYLDQDVDLKVHVNTYNTDEFMDFIRSYGFSVQVFQDDYTKGQPELVIDYPHYWKFFIAVRN